MLESLKSLGYTILRIEKCGFLWYYKSITKAPLKAAICEVRYYGFFRSGEE